MLSRSALALAAVLLAATSHAQVTITPGNAIFVDITGTGTVISPVFPYVGYGIISTVGNDLLPAGSLIFNTMGQVASPNSQTGWMGTHIHAPITPASTPQTAGFWTGSKVVCPWWGNLYCPSGSPTTLYWQEAGGVLYLQWNQMGSQYQGGGPTGPAITFQIQVLNGGGCSPSVIHMVYPDATFGGALAYYDYGTEATVGYISSEWGNAQYSHNTPVIQNGTSLTMQVTKFKQLWSSPFGPGSVKYDLCQGTPGATHQIVATVNAGAYPNGWLFGLDILWPELMLELGNSPFFGTLDGTGSKSLGPFAGLPGGLTLYSVAVIIPAAGLPTNPTALKTYTIP